MDVENRRKLRTTGSLAEAPAVEKSADAAAAGNPAETVAVENPAEAVVAGELTKATDAGLPGTGESAEVTDAELLKEHLCREILQTMTDFLQKCMASFSSAFSLLEWKSSEEYPEWGTDGHFFFCPADLLMEEFLKGVEALGAQISAYSVPLYVSAYAGGRRRGRTDRDLGSGLRSGGGVGGGCHGNLPR